MPSVKKKVTVKAKPPAKKKSASKAKPKGAKSRLKEEKAEEEEFRPPRIPKFLKEDEEAGKKKKKSEALDEELDNEPVYTDDYDNTIYSTEY